MQQLIQKLRSGETDYMKGDEEGQLIPINRPPTATALRAAKQLEVLSASLENLGNAYNALLHQHEQLQDAYSKCLESIQKLTESSQAGKPTPETSSKQGDLFETSSDQPTNNQS